MHVRKVDSLYFFKNFKIFGNDFLITCKKERFYYICKNTVHIIIYPGYGN